MKPASPISTILPRIKGRARALKRDMIAAMPAGLRSPVTAMLGGRGAPARRPDLRAKGASGAGAVDPALRNSPSPLPSPNHRHDHDRAPQPGPGGDDHRNHHRDKFGGNNGADRDDTLEDLTDRYLKLPVSPLTGEENARRQIQDQGQFLARQDRWDELSKLITDAETDRRATPCGMPHAELLSFGARSDVVAAMQDALFDDTDPTLDGIEALEDLLLEHYGDYAIATVVAQAHTDFGWAWRGQGWDHEVPQRNIDLFRAHLGRATAILDQHRSFQSRSPLMAFANCTLAVLDPGDPQRLADRYEALIDLYPGNPRPMRAMGVHLLPRWHGSYGQLELEARRTAARTRTTWGHGGYSWVMFDAFVNDPNVARVLDLEFFNDGLRDILNYHPDQHFANEIAAYTGILMAPNHTHPDAPIMLEEARAEVHALFDTVLCNHLHELHPLIWAEADMGPAASGRLPGRTELLHRGLKTARRTISHHFADDLMAGTTLTFTPDGLIRG